MTETRVPPRLFPVAIAALAIIGFLSVLVSSVTSMALPTLAAAFGVTMSSVVWVSTAFLLTAGLVLPAAGWAVDRFGGFIVLLIGLAVFATGSLGSGLAGTFEQLIVARAVQGLGGGILEPASLALIAQVTHRNRIGTVMGLMSIVIYLAPAIGPVLGAALVSSSGWRSAFLFAVPPVLLAGTLLAFSLRERTTIRAAEPAASPSTETSAFDLTGLLLLGVGFASVMLAITRISGGELWAPLLAGALGTGALAAYIRRARRVAAPIVDPKLFADRRFSGAVAIMGMGGVALFAILTLAPLLAARSWGLDGLSQTLPLGAFGLGMLVSMGVAGALSDRSDSRRIVTGAAGCTAGVLTALTLTMLLLPSSALIGTLLLLATGMGYGAVSAPTFASIYRVLPRDIAGRGTTTALIAVQVGAGLGATGIGAIVDTLGERAFTLVFALLTGLMLIAAVVARATLPKDGEPSRGRG